MRSKANNRHQCNERGAATVNTEVGVISGKDFERSIRSKTTACSASLNCQIDLQLSGLEERKKNYLVGDQVSNAIMGCPCCINTRHGFDFANNQLTSLMTGSVISLQPLISARTLSILGVQEQYQKKNGNMLVYSCTHQVRKETTEDARKFSPPNLEELKHRLVFPTFQTRTSSRSHSSLQSSSFQQSYQTCQLYHVAPYPSLAWSFRIGKRCQT